MPDTRPTRHPEAMPGAVRTQLQAILQSDQQADRVALVWHEPLQPEQQARTIGSHQVTLTWCPSELAIREALVEHAGPGKLVILSRFDQSQLGKDVLARLWKNEPQRINPWRTLEQLTRVQSIDPRLTRQQRRWMADALLRGFERFQNEVVFGEVLDLETAWLALARGYLDYTPSSLGLPELFRWSLQEGVAERVEALPESMREHLGDWLKPALPKVGGLVEALVRQGHAQDLLAVGLACTVMYGTDLSEAGGMEPSLVHSGRGRFIERYLGGTAFDQGALTTFGQAALETAEALLRQHGQKAIGHSLGQAEQILASLDFTPALVTSPLLPGGLKQRLGAFARALEAGYRQQRVDEAEQAWKSLQEHSLTRETQRHDQMRRAEMALRLLRWLTTADEGATDAAHRMLGRYVQDGSFVDWARSRMWTGEDHEELSRVYLTLSDAVTQRREQQNRDFSHHLPAIARGDALPEHQVPVERALDRVIAPLLAEKKSTLMLVLDGMNEAVYRELQEDLAAYGWIEVSERADAPARCLVSALPTATEFSRCSLLSGTLARGNAGQEKQAFSGHAGVKQHLSTKFPPVLLHKQELQQPGSGGLAPEARARIAGTEHKLVGVVINAIDDQLSSSSQVAVHWTLQSIPMLCQVLEAAREGGRAVVITSDHGHVLDHDAFFAQASIESQNGERYREEGAPPTEHEVEVSGPRVLTARHQAVLPWSERLRYTKGRNRGYHGGGSLQEVAIPLGIYISASDPAGVPGWAELPRLLPAWWLAADMPPLASEVPPPAEAPPTKGRKGRKAPATDEAIPDLFDAPAPTGQPADAEAARAGAADGDAWLEALFDSEVYRQTARRAGRVPVTDAQLRQLLMLLEEGRGTAMENQVAQRLGIPKIRLRGFLSAAKKLLNVDGYPVLKTDRESRTVVLDKESLKVQFEL